MSFDRSRLGAWSRRFFNLIEYWSTRIAAGDPLQPEEQAEFLEALKPIAERHALMENSQIPEEHRSGAEIVPLVPRHPRRPQGLPLPPKGAA